MLMAVAGCVAQAEGAGDRRAPAGGGYGGGAAILSPPAGDDRARQRAKAAMRWRPIFRRRKNSIPCRAPSASGVSAFLTVQEGCDKFCTFCVVPYTRGAEYSRRPEAILREARQLAEKGAREIMLLGQNVNAYRSSDGLVAWPGFAMRWRRSKALPASATPPAIPATWPTI